MSLNRKLIEWIVSGVISVILADLGLRVVSEEKYIGIITIIIAFIFLYITYYANQIGSNERKIKDIEDWKESKEELLNTLKDIVILKKVSKIK